MGPVTWLLGDRELTRDERRLVLRFAGVIAIPLALITMFALLAGFAVFRGQINGQVRQNKQAIVRADEAIMANKKLARQVSEESKERASAIAQAVFHECVENELQDNVLVNQVLRPTIRALERNTDTSPELQRYVDSLKLAVTAREPPDEPECKLPGGDK